MLVVVEVLMNPLEMYLEEMVAVEQVNHVEQMLDVQIQVAVAEVLEALQEVIPVDKVAQES
jgi:hypothetical protein